MEVEITGPVFEWRGPSPYYFVRLPDDAAAAVADVLRAVTYGWGMVPVTARIGTTDFTTSLWPQGDSFVLPLKVAVRRAEGLDVGDVVTAHLTLAL